MARREPAVSVVKIGVSGTGSEDHDPSFFEVADGAAADIGLGDLFHFDGAEQAGVESLFFEAGLQGHAVNDGGQHTHVVAVCPLNSGFRFVHTPINVSATDHDGHLHAEFGNGFYVFGILGDHIGIEAEALIAHERFAGEFQEDAFVFGKHAGGISG